MRERGICSPTQGAKTVEYNIGCSIVKMPLVIQEISCEPRRAVVKLQPRDKFWNISTHSDCLHNEIRSLEGRVLRQTSRAHPRVMSYLMSTVQNLESRLPLVGSIPMESVISVFPQSRRKHYLKALNSLLESPLHRRDELIKAFVKSEKLKILSNDGDPRMIQARTPRFNILFAMYTRAIEKALYYLRDDDGLKMIAKGLNMRQRAEVIVKAWSLYREPMCLSLDLSRWDMHCRVEMLALMRRFYLKVLNDPLFRQLLEVLVKNLGITANGIVYKSLGGVMSGDMTTALGNCTAVILVVTGLAKLIKEWLNNEEIPQIVRVLFRKMDRQVMERLAKHVVFTVIDDGDDHVLIGEREVMAEVAKILPGWFELIGHELKVEGTTSEVHNVLFCQCKPLYHHGRWEMMPDPRKVLATSFIIPGNHAKQAAEYLGTVWEARALLHQGQPILGPLFNRLSNENRARLDLTPEAKLNILAGLTRQMGYDGRTKVTQREISMESREMVSEMWGISPEEQLMLEKEPYDIPGPVLPMYWHQKEMGELRTYQVCGTPMSV